MALDIKRPVKIHIVIISNSIVFALCVVVSVKGNCNTMFNNVKGFIAFSRIKRLFFAYALSAMRF
jgi:hypothetical protein